MVKKQLVVLVFTAGEIERVRYRSKHILEHIVPRQHTTHHYHNIDDGEFCSIKCQRRSEASCAEIQHAQHEQDEDRCDEQGQRGTVQRIPLHLDQCDPVGIERNQQQSHKNGAPCDTQAMLFVFCFQYRKRLASGWLFSCLESKEDERDKVAQNTHNTSAHLRSLRQENHICSLNR